MRFIRQLILLITICIIQVSFVSAQTHSLELINHAFYGSTRAASFDDSLKKVFTLAGNTIVKYIEDISDYNDVFHFDSYSYLYTLHCYEVNNETYIYAFSEDSLFIFMDSPNEFILLNKLRLISTLNTNSGSKNIVFIKNQRIYCVLQNSIAIYSIEMPTSPVLKNEIFLNAILGISLKDSNYIYLSSIEQSTHKINIFDPINPDTLISIVNVPLTPAGMYDKPIHNIEIFENRLIVTTPSNTFEIDIENVNSPQVAIPNLSFFTDNRYISVSGNRLYFYSDVFFKTISIYDITTPLQYTLIDTMTSPDLIWESYYDSTNNEHFLITIGGYGVRKFNTTTLDSVYLISDSDPTGSYLKDIDIIDNNLLICDSETGLTSINVANSLSPVFLSNFGEQARSFVKNPNVDSVGYITTGHYSGGGLYTINLSDVSNLKSYNFYDTQGGALNFYVNENVGYLLSTREAALLIFNLSSPTNPLFSGTYSLPGTPRQLIVKDSIGYLAFSKIVGDDGLLTLDLTDPFSPVVLDSVHVTPTGVSGIDIYQNYALIISFHKGLSFVDISHPNNLNLLLNTDIVRGRSISVDGKYVFISGPSHVSVVSIIDPINPEVVGKFQLPSIAENVEVVKDTIYVAGGSTGLYILRFDSTLANIEDENQHFIENYFLFQNYPNPFNPITKIKFKLSFTDKVKIEVFNILGQKIIVLLDKRMPSGIHEVEFNSKDLPSGIYFYRIKSGNYNEEKKMLLLR